MQTTGMYGSKHCTVASQDNPIGHTEVKLISHASEKTGHQGQGQKKNSKLAVSVLSGYEKTELFRGQDSRVMCGALFQHNTIWNTGIGCELLHSDQQQTNQYAVQSKTHLVWCTISSVGRRGALCYASLPTLIRFPVISELSYQKKAIKRQKINK